MHWRNPNRPERIEDPRPKKREYESNTGNEAVDGYTVCARRPRVPGMTDTVSPERADSIERVLGIQDD